MPPQQLDRARQGAAGGRRREVAELDWLLGNAGQFAWGPAGCCGDEVAALLPRLREAKAWVARVRRLNWLLPCHVPAS